MMMAGVAFHGDADRSIGLPRTTIVIQRRPRLSCRGRLI
jgi:hypothetical protein